MYDNLLLDTPIKDDIFNVRPPVLNPMNLLVRGLHLVSNYCLHTYKFKPWAGDYCDGDIMLHGQAIVGTCYREHPCHAKCMYIYIYICVKCKIVTIIISVLSRK